jgi:hypothetical protein
MVYGPGTRAARSRQFPRLLALRSLRPLGGTRWSVAYAVFGRGRGTCLGQRLLVTTPQGGSQQQGGEDAAALLQEEGGGYWR